jgi:hypothetical protein
VLTPKDDVNVSKIYTHTGDSFFVYYQVHEPISGMGGNLPPS